MIYKVVMKRTPGTPLYELIRLMEKGYSAMSIYAKLTTSEYDQAQVYKEIRSLQLIYNLLGHGMSFVRGADTVTFFRTLQPIRDSKEYTKKFERFCESEGYNQLIGFKPPQSLKNYAYFTMRAIWFKRFLNNTVGAVYESDSTDLVAKDAYISAVCKACGPYGRAFAQALSIYEYTGNTHISPEEQHFASLGYLYDKRIPTAVVYWRLLKRMKEHFEDSISYVSPDTK